VFALNLILDKSSSHIFFKNIGMFTVPFSYIAAIPGITKENSSGS